MAWKDGPRLCARRRRPRYAWELIDVVRTGMLMIHLSKTFITCYIKDNYFLLSQSRNLFHMEQGRENTEKGLVYVD